jgi:hypothetical protein
MSIIRMKGLNYMEGLNFIEGIKRLLYVCWDIPGYTFQTTVSRSMFYVVGHMNILSSIDVA